MLFSIIKMKKKLFTSTNSKKGLLLESEDDGITISVWKKETPISVKVSKEPVLEMHDFFVEEFGDNEDAEKAEFWSNYVKDFISERANKVPEDYSAEPYEGPPEPPEEQ